MLGKCMSVLQYYELNAWDYCTVNHVMSVIMKLFEAKCWPSSMQTEKLKPIWWAGSSQAWVPSVWTHEVADVDDAFRNSIRQSALQNDTKPPTTRGNSRFLCHGDGDGDGAGGLQQLVQPGTVAGADDLVAVGDTKPHLALCRHLLEPARRAASPQQSTPAALSSSAAMPRPAKASFKGDKARRNAGATPRPTPGLWRSGRPRQTRRRRVLVCLSSSAATPRPAPAKASSKADKACRNAAATPRPITGLGRSGRRGSG